MIFYQINELITKNYSSLSNINQHYYLKHQIPKKLTQIFKIISQSPEYIETQCNDMVKPPNFAIRKWMIEQKCDVVIVSVTILEDITIE